jgi:hypothetical protein
MAFADEERFRLVGPIELIPHFAGRDGDSLEPWPNWRERGQKDEGYEGKTKESRSCDRTSATSRLTSSP